MTPIAIIEGIATLLWVHAGFALGEWIIHLVRLDRRHHIAAVMDLLGNLVPAMIALIVVVMAGALIGLPSVVVLIAVLFPAGLAFGAQMALNDLRNSTDPRREIARLAVMLIVGAGVIYARQLA